MDDDFDFDFDFDFDDSDFGSNDDNSNAKENTVKGSNVEQEGSFDDSLDSMLNNEGGTASDFEDALEQATGTDSLINHDLSGKKEISKTAIFTIACGVGIIALILIVTFIINLVSHSGNNDKPANNVNVQQNSQVVQNTTTSNANSNKSSSSTNGWILFETTDAVINSKYTDSLFSVTRIEHYVKKVDSNAVELKTVLYGGLSGMPGTYELEVPYSLGSKLNIGDSFDVQIKLGSLAGNTTLVDDIKYIF